MSKRRWVAVEGGLTIAVPPEQAGKLAEILTHAVVISRSWNSELAKTTISINTVSHPGVEFIDEDEITAAIVAAKLIGE